MSKHYFNNITPNQFRKIAKGRQVYIQVGQAGPFCRSSKKDFYKCAAGYKLSGFTSEEALQYIWVTKLENF